MKKQLFSMLLCLGAVGGAAICPLPTFAAVAQNQTIKVKGQVVDENGEPLIGATVRLKDAATGVITDFDGNFSIDCKSNATLIVSYMGYKTREIAVRGRAALEPIELTSDTNVLDQVVVVGYGVQKKADLTGSVSIVNADELKKVSNSNISTMLEGKVPGVQITSDGQPGADPSVRIRGIGSFGSTAPLYVIDGVPMGTTIRDFSPNDIETIQVLKDAAAGAIYGSRAANGVIIITTKQGQQGKPKVSLQADWGYSDFAMDYRPVMNGQQRRDYIYNGLYAGQIRKGKTEQEATAYADDNIDDYAPIPWCGFIDWDDVLFKKGSHQQYEASVSGGADKFKYYSSIAYLKQDGITHRSGLERLTGRLNVDYKATNRLTLGANIFFSSVNQDVYSEGFTYTAPFYSSRSAVTPSDPVYNEDGTWNRAFIRIGDRNPALANEYDSQREYVTRTFNTV